MKEFNLGNYLNGDNKRLYDIVGEALFIEIIRGFGGMDLYISKEALRIWRNYRIYRDYMDKMSIKDIARKWKLSESGVRYIIKKMHREVNK